MPRKRRGCIHCHNINEIQRADYKAQGRWKRDDFWVYPLPENIGLGLEIDRGNQVKKVQLRSSVEKAGIEPGDIVTQLNGYSIASFADAQFALHKAPAKGEISIRWLHEGKEQSAKLELIEGWRKTNLSWRPSLVDYLPSLPISGEDIGVEEKMKMGITENQLAVRQDKFVHSTLKKIGLQKGDIVVGLSGQKIDGKMKTLLDRVRSNYLAGDKVTLEVLREGEATQFGDGVEIVCIQEANQCSSTVSRSTILHFATLRVHTPETTGLQSVTSARRSPGKS